MKEGYNRAKGVDRWVCWGKGSVQILGDLKIQVKFKIDSTGARALMSPLQQEHGLRTFVWLVFLSKDTSTYLLTHLISQRAWSYL